MTQLKLMKKKSITYLILLRFSILVNILPYEIYHMKVNETLMGSSVLQQLRVAFITIYSQCDGENAFNADLDHVLTLFFNDRKYHTKCG